MAAEGELKGSLPMVVRPYRTGDRLDRIFDLAIVACLAATFLVLVPGIHGHAVLPTVDLVIDTVAAVACASLTALAWARFRERRIVAAAYQAGAFLALAVAYGAAVLETVYRGDSIGDLAQPVGVQVLMFAVARLAAAVLLVIAGVFTQRRTYGWQPSLILVGPALLVLLVALVGLWVGSPPEALQIIVFTDGSPLPHITPFGAVIHLVTAALFFVAAYVSRAQWRVNHAVVDGWIAVGLVFAGFAELHWTLYPSAHPGQVSTADLMRLACSVALLIGLVSAVKAALRELQATNLELAALREAEVERAALEERARLARELHDGLAQDLWLAKLRTGELTSMDDLSDEARRAAQAAAAAIEVGLGGAREAVAALRSSAHAESGFCSLVRQTVEDYGDRYGFRVEFSFEGEHQTRIPARTQAEILRIAQEAMTNVVRHANATIVGVRLAIREERITLKVVDNGRGFDIASVGRDSFGLASMRERAALIGGRLRVASRAGAGTRVVLAAPFSRPAAHAEADLG